MTPIADPADARKEDLEDVFQQAQQALSLVCDTARAFMAAPDVIVTKNTWWAISRIAHDANAAVDRAYGGLPGAVIICSLEDWAPNNTHKLAVQLRALADTMDRNHRTEQLRGAR